MGRTAAPHSQPRCTDTSCDPRPPRRTMSVPIEVGLLVSRLRREMSGSVGRFRPLGPDLVGTSGSASLCESHQAAAPRPNRHANFSGKVSTALGTDKRLSDRRGPTTMTPIKNREAVGESAVSAPSPEPWVTRSSLFETAAGARRVLAEIRCAPNSGCRARESGSVTRRPRPSRRPHAQGSRAARAAALAH